MRQREYMRDVSKARTKFNAWNSAEQKMYFNVGIDPYAADGYVFDQNGAIDDMYGFPPTLLQFTGLLDKNGKEIYEGHILGLDDPEDASRAVVVFRDAAFKAQLVISGIIIYSTCWDGWVVIGNKFEHSHLLEQSEANND